MLNSILKELEIAAREYAFSGIAKSNHPHDAHSFMAGARAALNLVQTKLEEKDKRIEELENKLEAFTTARILAGPEDVKEYIHNHEKAHKK